MASTQEDWQATAAATREAREASIPAEWRIPTDEMPTGSILDVTKFPVDSGMFSDFELAITDAGAVEIVDKIKARQWTAEEVTKAFCKQAAVAHQLVRGNRSCSTVPR